MASGKDVGLVLTTENLQGQGHDRGLQSKLVESSPRHSLGTLNIRKSRLQGTDCVDPQQVPLMGYEDF